MNAPRPPVMADLKSRVRHVSRSVALAIATLVVVILSWVTPLAPSAPPSGPDAPPAWFCPSGQHLIRTIVGLPECVR